MNSFGHEAPSSSSASLPSMDTFWIFELSNLRTHTPRHQIPPRCACLPRIHLPPPLGGIMPAFYERVITITTITFARRIVCVDNVTSQVSQPSSVTVSSALICNERNELCKQQQPTSSSSSRQAVRSTDLSLCWRHERERDSHA